MKFEDVKEAKGVLKDRTEKLKRIYDQAGEELDMSKVTDISGDSKSKVEQMQALNAEMAEAASDVKAFEDAAKDRESFLENERKSKGVNAPKGDLDKPSAAGGGEFKGLGDLIVASSAYQDGKGSKMAVVGAEYGLKTLFETAAGWAPESVRTGRVVDFATRPIQVVDMLPAGRTSQAAIKYMEETTFTNNAAEVAEGGTYGEAALKLTERTSPVEKIGVWLPMTDEQLEDEPQARSYINNRLPFMIRQRLDGQVLNGDGTGSNLTGILNTAGIQTQARAADTNEDAFFKAMVRVQTTGQAMPSAHMMNPTNWQTIRLRKTADGIYIFGPPAQVGAMTLWGLPVVEAQAIALGTGLTGDYNNFIELTERRGIEVKITDSHSTDFINGKLAVRADMRVALTVYRPAAFSSVTGLN